MPTRKPAAQQRTPQRTPLQSGLIASEDEEDSGEESDGEDDSKKEMLDSDEESTSRQQSGNAPTLSEAEDAPSPLPDEAEIPETQPEDEDNQIPLAEDEDPQNPLSEGGDAPNNISDVGDLGSVGFGIDDDQDIPVMDPGPDLSVMDPGPDPDIEQGFNRDCNGAITGGSENPPQDGPSSKKKKKPKRKPKAKPTARSASKQLKKEGSTRQPKKEGSSRRRRRRKRKRQDAYDIDMEEHGRQIIDLEAKEATGGPRRSKRTTKGMKPLEFWRGERLQIERKPGEMTSAPLLDDSGRAIIHKGFGNTPHREKIRTHVNLVHNQGKRPRRVKRQKRDHGDIKESASEIKRLKAENKKLKKENKDQKKEISANAKALKKKESFWLKKLQAKLPTLNITQLDDPFNEKKNRQIDGEMWVEDRKENGRERKTCIAKSRFMVPTRMFVQHDLPDGEKPSAERTMMGGKALEEEDFSSGFLKLPPLGKKYKEAPQMAEVFYVMGCADDTLKVHIQDNELALCTGDVFFIPPSNEYWLENTSEDTEVNVFFVLIKSSTIKQDDLEQSEDEEDDG